MLDFKMAQTSGTIANAKRSNAAVYCSLRGAKNTIRLLHASRDRNGKVTWYLEHYELGSLPRCRYSALSYIWGDGALSKTIILNNRIFRVLESVFAVLEEICHNTKFSSGDSWWWIDSVCISQNDNRERAAQVKLMGRIYQDSYRTIGWLGKCSGNTGRVEDYAFTKRGDEAIKSLHILNDYHYDITIRPNPRRAIEIVGKLVNWKAVEELLLRPWWTRVWTLQEYLLPPTFDFWCARSHISRESLNRAISVVPKIRLEPGYGHIINSQSWFPVWNRRRLFNWYQEKDNKLPLVALVAHGSDNKATDPKDRIYSVLGLAKRKLDKGLVLPNYNQSYSASDAYTDLVKAFVEKHNSLDIICYVHIFNQKGPSSRRVPELPSWVPDWTAEVQPLTMQVMASQGSNACIGNFRPVHEHKGSKPYAASGTRRPKYKFSEDNKTLKCRGIIVDTIGNMNGTTRQRRHTALSQKKASAILDDLSKTLVIGRKGEYLNTPCLPNNFYHEFRAFCFAAIKRPEDVPDSFFHWFRLNRGLVIQGHTLQEICEQSLKRPELFRKKDKTSHSRGRYYVYCTDGGPMRAALLEKPQDANTHRPAKLSTQNPFFLRFRDTTQSMAKMLVTTKNDYFGMAPKQAQKGDKICVLLGCNIPLVLRKKVTPGEGDRKMKYEVIGEFYMDGFMDGEAVEMADKGELQYEDFRLV
jgi:hypothetical protein